MVMERATQGVMTRATLQTVPMSDKGSAVVLAKKGRLSEHKTVLQEKVLPWTTLCWDLMLVG